MMLDKRIFDTEATEQPNGEYYVTEQLAALAKRAPLMVVTQNVWIPIGYPEDIQNAEKLLS
jgi:NDP-sugar pyrophosphorylase family protein